MNLGARLKLERNNLGVTQEYVANELNVSRQTISSWENERSYPDIESLILLSEYYHLSLDILLKEDAAMIADMKKRTELANVKLMLWGSTIINLGILCTMLLKLVGVQAFEMELGAMIVLVIIELINVTFVFYTKNRLLELTSSNTLVKSKFKFNSLNITIISIILAGIAIFMYINKVSLAFIIGIFGGLFLGVVILYFLKKRMA